MTITIEPPTFPDGEIDKFIQRRVCARCYGDLVKSLAPERMWAATCPNCGGTWGYATVSRAYVEHLGQQALASAYEVRANLPDLFQQRSGKSSQQLIEELGF